MGRNKLEHLVGKLLSMHLAVPGAVAHLYHIQRPLEQVGGGNAWLLSYFHWEINNWSALVVQMIARPRHLAEIVCQKPTHLGFCNASGIGARGVWLNPSRLGTSLM